MAIEVDRREVYRYLGTRGAVPEEALVREVEAALEALEAVAEPRRTYRRFPLERMGEDALEIDGLRLDSRALAKNLKGCHGVYLMAATLGLGPDRLIARAQAAGSMHRAVTLQAAAAAMIEALCDRVNDELRALATARGEGLRPRFSPGYGDLSLACQPGLFRLLDIQRQIGVTLTGSLMMIPTKSVTAVVGISDAGCGVPAGCAACGRTDCNFRKDNL